MPLDLEVIHRGKLALETIFPNRFTGGFSPPFDALPPWLPAAWHREGGTFISCLYTNDLDGSSVPVVRAGVDIWNWSEDRAAERHELRRRLEYQAFAHGHVGIVLHPRCLRTQWERARLVSILNSLQASGLSSTSLRELTEKRATGGRRGLFRQGVKAFFLRFRRRP
jgi:hypothetical protein